MENKKCSSKKHEEINALFFCQECKIYMCNKCQNIHLELFQNHHEFKLDKDINDIFTGFCKEKNHLDKLKYFCSNHNILCCAACIAKIKGKGDGQHSDCKIYYIEDMKEEKKNKLKDNIEYLTNLSNIFEESILELKKIFEKINEQKEEIKIKIQKTFTKIRNAIDTREEELLMEVDKNYENFFLKEKIIREAEKLPNQIKISLEKGRKMGDEWNNENKLNSLINDCINIENNIKKIDLINENIQKFNKLNNIKINFYPEEESDINDFYEIINNFGKISKINSFPFQFKNCPKNIKESRQYLISGVNKNILTKTGTDCVWMGTICESELKEGNEYKWKIKILKTKLFNIDVGVASSDFDINSSTEKTCGWYFACDNSYLYSGPPHKYSGRQSNIKKPKNEIIVVMNMNKRTLKFIVDNEDKGDSYTDIPIDKPLYPAVLLYHLNDSIEILEC